MNDSTRALTRRQKRISLNTYKTPPPPPPKQKYQTCKEPALLYFEVRSALVRMNKNRAIDAVLIEMSLALNDFEIHKKRNIQQNLQKASENTSS